MGYNIDPSKIFRNNEIEAVCERDLAINGNGRILIKMREDFLLEFNCYIYSSNSSKNNVYNYQEMTEEIWSRIQTISNGEKNMNLSPKTVTFMAFNRIYKIDVPKDYLFYKTYSEVSAINVIKPVSADENCSELEISQNMQNTGKVIKTIESSFLGSTVTWYICDDGTAYANTPICHMYIKNSNDEEILEFIKIVQNIICE